MPSIPLKSPPFSLIFSSSNNATLLLRCTNPYVLCRHRLNSYPNTQRWIHITSFTSQRSATSSTRPFKAEKSSHLESGPEPLSRQQHTCTLIKLAFKSQIGRVVSSIPRISACGRRGCITRATPGLAGALDTTPKFRQVFVAVWSFCPHSGSGLPTLATIIQIPSQSLSQPFPKHRAALALFGLAASAPWPYLVCAHSSLTHWEWAPVFNRQLNPCSLVLPGPQPESHVLLCNRSTQPSASQQHRERDCPTESPPNTFRPPGNL